MANQRHEPGCPDCHIPLLRSHGREVFGWHCNRCDRDFHMENGLLHVGYAKRPALTAADFFGEELVP